jgi:hypothetical protein
LYTILKVTLHEATHQPSIIFNKNALKPDQLAASQRIEQYFLGHARDDAAHMSKAFLPTAHIDQYVTVY